MRSHEITHLNITTFERKIIRHEGFKRFAYTDSVGSCTIGCGRNVDARGGIGLSPDEVIYLLRNDLKRVEYELMQFSWYRHIDSRTRQEALIEFVFNIGLTDFLDFKKTITALIDQDYDKAAAEMLDSLWADQVGYRAVDVSERIKNG